MKLITATLLTALAGFATTAARADHSRVNVAVGINLGSSYRAPAYVAPAPVYVAPAPVYVSPGHRHDRDRGHWENVTVKTWVPARWVTTHNHWGHPVRILEKGYFTFRTDRVWVDHRGHDHRDNRYGYSHNNDGWRR